MANRGAKGGKKAAKSYERPGLSDEEIEEIKEAFNLFDTDGSGMFFTLEEVSWFCWANKARTYMKWNDALLATR